MGQLCRDCLAEIESRARRIARLIALGSTIVLALYVYLRVPADPMARTVSGAAVLAWYILTGLVARRILREALK